MWGHRGGAGAGCRGQGRGCCVPVLHIGKGTEAHRGTVRGCAPRLAAFEPSQRPIGARRAESEAGGGRRGARRASAVAFRGLDRLFAKVVHKIGALQLDKITPKLHVKITSE